MELQIALKPAGTTTQRELAELSTEVQNALRRHREVEQVAPQRETAPEGAKGIAEALGAFLVGLPPGAVSGVFDLLKGVLVRAPETPVTVEISSGSTKLTFDPRRVTPAQMAELVERMRRAGGTG
jgi:uncharacterized protein YqgV (UPF0045/DUF77 family)